MLDWSETTSIKASLRGSAADFPESEPAGGSLIRPLRFPPAVGPWDVRIQRVTRLYSGPLWPYRMGMLLGAAIVLPAACALIGSTPFGRGTAIGSVLVCGGLVLLRLWWLLHDKRTGAARRIQVVGAALTLAAIALFETSLVLFLGRSPGDPIGAYVACVACAGVASCCLAARMAVGLKARRLARASGPWGRGVPWGSQR